MIREKMYKKIQKYKRKGYSKTEIITVLGKDPKTVAKYYALDEKGFRLTGENTCFGIRPWRTMRKTS